MAANNLNPVVVSDTVEGSSFLSKLREHTINNTPQGSGDIRVKKTAGGVAFEINKDLISGHHPINYQNCDDTVYTLPQGTDPNAVDVAATINTQVINRLSQNGVTDSYWWNKDRAYNIGDIVRVQRIGFAGWDNDQYNQKQPLYVFPGTYVCVSPVPKNYTSDEKRTISSITDPDLKKSIEDTYRKTDVCYYPIWKHFDNPYGMWPEEKILGQMNTMLGGNSKGRYWELIAFLPTKVKICINGEDNYFMVNGCMIPNDPTTIEAL